MLPFAFYQRLNQLPNVNFKLGASVSGIYYQNNLITLETIKQKEKYYETFDYVICAIPFSALRTMEIFPSFSVPKMLAIRDINYCNAQKTLLFCTERFWERGNTLGVKAKTDLLLATQWFPSSKATSKAGVLTASYNVDMDATRLKNLTNERRFDLIKRQVEQIHGLPRNYLDRVVIDHITVDWNSNPYSLGAFSWYDVGQKGRFSYVSTLPEYNNQLFFAGEHISPFHAWMQGALQTGMLAANNLALNIKKSLFT